MRPSKQDGWTSADTTGHSSPSSVAASIHSDETRGVFVNGPAGIGREVEVGGLSERTVHCMLLGDGMVGKTSLAVGFLQLGLDDHYTATLLEQYTVPTVVAGKQFTVNVFDTAGQNDHEALRAYAYNFSEVLVLCFSVCDRHTFNSLIHHWLPEVRRNLGERQAPLLLVGTQVDLKARRGQEPAERNIHTVEVCGSFNGHRGQAPVEGHQRDDQKVSGRQGHYLGADPTGLHQHASPQRHYTKFAGHPKYPASHTRSGQHHHDHLADGGPPRSLHNISTHHIQPADHSEEGRNEVTHEEGCRMADELGAECYVECSARTLQGLHEVFKQVVLAALRKRYDASTHFPTTPASTANSDIRSRTATSSSRKWSPRKFFGRLFPVRYSFRLASKKVGLYHSMPSLFTKFTT